MSSSARPATVLAEADLEEEWVEGLADPARPESIDQQCAAFADFMDAGLRDRLEEPESRADVRRTTRAEIATRRGG